MMGIPKQGPVVAIDGPAGTGKSSVTKRLSEILGFIHVDTGALYRALAVLCMDRHLSLKVPLTEEVQNQASELAEKTHLEFKYDPGLQPPNRIFADGVDLTSRIRTPEVSMGASAVSAVPAVRAALLGLQRKLGCKGQSILEGRDIGTVIFPDADVKFFMVATVEERAKRRLKDLIALGQTPPSLEEIKNQMVQRDENDSKRAAAPLKKAEDAIELDTTMLTLDQVVDKMAETIRLKIKR